MTSTFATQNARLVDQAVPAPEGKPISPNVSLNLGLGLVGGLGLGLAFAFFVAFIDDRVKSSYDIEGVVGLPLIGIIPEVKRLDSSEKARVVASNADRQVAEAFRTLHSSLRLKDESKNAKAFLTTSTIPGEGKSFTTTNLALTFAAHGEKVGVKVTLENHWGLTANPMNIRVIIDEVNSPYCEASPDFCNWEHEYMLYHGLAALAPYAHTTVHAKYWNRWKVNDIARSVKIMTAARFMGIFCLEYEDGPWDGVEGAKYLYKEVLAAL
mgnify:CR=1 FL=1